MRAQEPPASAPVEASPSAASAPSTWRSSSPPWASTASSPCPSTTVLSRAFRSNEPDGRRSRRPAPAAAAARRRRCRALAAAACASASAQAVRNEKEPPEGGSRSKKRRRPTLPGRCRPSTIGAEGLNCSVRNGKRCFPLAITTEIVSRPRGSVGAAGPRRGLKTALQAKRSYSGDQKTTSSPRPISTGLLSVSPRLHSRPINLVVYQGSYSLKGMGELISRSASRLDAFSGYPIRT